jgi:hypothetical protein
MRTNGLEPSYRAFWKYLSYVFVQSASSRNTARPCCSVMPPRHTAPITNVIYRTGYNLRSLGAFHSTVISRTRIMAQAPSAGELEIALHQLLRKQQFTGVEHIRVSVMGPASSPAYLVFLSPDTGKALLETISAVLLGRAPVNPTTWVLYPAEAVTIIRAVEL